MHCVLAPSGRASWRSKNAEISVHGPQRNVRRIRAKIQARDLACIAIRRGQGSPSTCRQCKFHGLEQRRVNERETLLVLFLLRRTVHMTANAAFLYAMRESTRTLQILVLSRIMSTHVQRDMILRYRVLGNTTVASVCKARGFRNLPSTIHMHYKRPPVR